VDRSDRSSRMQWLRRATQYASLVAFVLLVVVAPWMDWGLLPSQLFSRLDPLVGLTAVLASRTLMAYAALGLLTVGLTLAFGRAWCGWLCPLGTMLDVVPARSRAGSRRLAGWLRHGKYVTFVVVVGAAAMGTLALMVLDPITIVMRPLQELAMPLVGSDAVGISVGGYLSRDAIGLVAYLSLVPLAIVLLLNAVARRFWCRSLCPLGGMLSLLSTAALVRRHVDQGACTKCGTCARECPTSAIMPKKGFASAPTECTTCQRCVDVCPESAISFGVVRDLKPVHGPDRREALVTLGATGASLAAVLVAPKAASASEILRPPSTDEARLAERCVRCGACYAACPTGALRPSTSLMSESGLWTPMLDERPPHCTWNCNLCAAVCPTDALHTPTAEEAEALGLDAVAWVDRQRCVAWARGKDCFKCSTVCPIAGALTSVKTRAATPFGIREAKAPVVVPDLCIACGLCSTVCPASPPAIHVTR